MGYTHIYPHKKQHCPIFLKFKIGLTESFSLLTTFIFLLRKSGVKTLQLKNRMIQWVHQSSFFLCGMFLYCIHIKKDLMKLILNFIKIEDASIIFYVCIWMYSHPHLYIQKLCHKNINNNFNF